MNHEELKRLSETTRPEKPETCARAVRQLCELAPWVLAPEVLAVAARVQDPWASPEIRTLAAMRPALPQDPGTATILLVVRDPQYRALFGEALALPVHWERDVPHSEMIPGALADVADKVLDAIEPSADYGLSLDGATLGAEVDLRSWSLRCDSAFFSLAAALELLDVEGTADPRVLISACWQRGAGVGGVGGVEGIEAKVALAVRLKARQLFVAESDVPRAEKAHATAALEIRGLKTPTRDTRRLLRDCMAPLLEVLEVPPGRDADLEKRTRYYDRASRLRRFDYYTDNLLEDLVALCHGRGIQGWGKEQRLEALVSFVATRPEGSLFAIRVLSPKRVLLLHTAQTCPGAHELKTRLEAQGISASLAPVSDEREVVVAVESFCGGLAATVIGADVTPGPKWYTVGLMGLPAASPLFYLDQPRWARERKPGEERLRRIQRPLQIEGG